MSEPILCFNGKECSYSDDVKCIHYQGTVEQGSCLVNHLKNPITPQPTGDRTAPTPQAPTQEQSPLQKIKPGDYVQKITVTMLEAATAKTVTAQGEEKEIIEVLVTDQHENAQLTVWPPLAQNVKVKPAGTVLHLEALGSSEYKGQLQLKSTRKTAISYE